MGRPRIELSQMRDQCYFTLAISKGIKMQRISLVSIIFGLIMTGVIIGHSLTNIESGQLYSLIGAFSSIVQSIAAVLTLAVAYMAYSSWRRQSLFSYHIDNLVKIREALHRYTVSALDVYRASSDEQLNDAASRLDDCREEYISALFLHRPLVDLDRDLETHLTYGIEDKVDTFIADIMSSNAKSKEGRKYRQQTFRTYMEYRNHVLSLIDKKLAP